ncbi:hypothetical protein D3C87_1868260 [compost metagenome]
MTFRKSVFGKPLDLLKALLRELLPVIVFSHARDKIAFEFTDTSRTFEGRH